jgi:hypothetical protein
MQSPSERSVIHVFGRTEILSGQRHDLAWHFVATEHSHLSTYQEQARRYVLGENELVTELSGISYSYRRHVRRRKI